MEITKVSQLKNIPFEEWPTNNRPRAWEDLDWSDKLEENIFHVENFVFEDPDLLPLWETLIVEAKKNRKVKVSGTNIVRINDGDEIDRKIAQKQEDYDRNKQNLFDDLSKGKPQSEYFYRNYCRVEGLEWDIEKEED